MSTSSSRWLLKDVDKSSVGVGAGGVSSIYDWHVELTFRE